MKDDPTIKPSIFKTNKTKRPTPQENDPQCVTMREMLKSALEGHISISEIPQYQDSEKDKEVRKGDFWSEIEKEIVDLGKRIKYFSYLVIQQELSWADNHELNFVQISSLSNCRASPWPLL